jgi:hypothetical protein
MFDFAIKPPSKLTPIATLQLGFRRLTKHNLFQSGLLKSDEAESITSKDRHGYECPNFTQPLHKIGSETRAVGTTVWF